MQERYETSRIGPGINISKNPYAVVALGGYGRQEQCIHSDVDLLFLFEQAVPDACEELVREFTFPLWDAGIQVGHTTRAIDECAAMADQNIEIFTSLLDARFICGVSIVYTRFLDTFHERLIRDRAEELTAWLISANTERHSHFGDSTYLLEPNLKEGQGGLRDYHTMLWIGRIRSSVRQARDLEYYGYISHDEFQHLIKALTFIWTLRNRVHRLAERKCDQLFFDYQEKLADALGYVKNNGQQPVELFLSELHGQMNFIKAQYMRFIYELTCSVKYKRKKDLPEQVKIEGLHINRAMLNFTSPEAILKSPHLLIQIFEESARRKLPLRAEARRLVTDFLHLVDERFISSPEAVRAFERILISAPGEFNVLNEMLNTGFLVKFIPEFHEVRHRIQYDEYHVHPVDKHLLRTVLVIKRFGTPEDVAGDPFYADLYHNGISDKTPLLWAALLHDIGKGAPGGNHSDIGADMASRIMSVKGCGAEAADTVSFLVKEHLTLVKVATRRDITDEETAISSARRIQDPDRLKMLYLLTVADCLATGPKAWNNWIAALLRTHFLNVLNILEKGELASREAVASVEKKKDDFMAFIRDDQVRPAAEALFNVMSPRYLLDTAPADMFDHFRLYRKAGDDRFAWNIETASDSDTRIITVCTKDFPGLFSKLSGVFTLSGVNILNAQIYTWRNNMALDIFQVTPPKDRIYESLKWEQAAENLDAALAGRLDLSAALKDFLQDYRKLKHSPSQQAPRVAVDNHSSSFFTIVEVFAYDFPGLLFKITDALFRCKLDIWVAKIATNRDQIVDVFYVRDFDGQKIDAPDQVREIETTVREVLP